MSFGVAVSMDGFEQAASLPQSNNLPYVPRRNTCQNRIGNISLMIYMMNDDAR